MFFWEKKGDKIICVYKVLHTPRKKNSNDNNKE